MDEMAAVFAVPASREGLRQEGARCEDHSGGSSGSSDPRGKAIAAICGVLTLTLHSLKQGSHLKQGSRSGRRRRRAGGHRRSVCPVQCTCTDGSRAGSFSRWRPLQKLQQEPQSRHQQNTLTAAPPCSTVAVTFWCSACSTSGMETTEAAAAGPAAPSANAARKAASCIMAAAGRESVARGRPLGRLRRSRLQPWRNGVVGDDWGQ